jgi:hypothetical protein
MLDGAEDRLRQTRVARKRIIRFGNSVLIFSHSSTVWRRAAAVVFGIPLPVCETRRCVEEIFRIREARAWADGDFDADHGLAFDGVGRLAH